MMTPHASANPEIENYKKLFNGLVEQSVAGVYLLQDSVLTYVNETFASMCGIPRSRLMGRSLYDVAPTDQREALLAQYGRRLRGEAPDARFIVRAQPRNGKLRLIEIHGTLIDYEGKPAVVGVGIDITEREQKHEELQRSEVMLSDLLSHIDTVREDERIRISMELHDAIGGMLTAVKFDIARTRKRVQQLIADTHQLSLLEPQHHINEALHETTLLIQETIVAVRQISEDLRPSVLQHFGIAVAIANDLKRFEKRYNILCTFEEPKAMMALSDATASDLYRIFQEAMNNIAKHAMASRASIRLDIQDQHLTLDVIDDGCGIVDDASKSKRYGIMGMKERARRLSGNVMISAVPSGGTHLSVRLPLSALTA